MRIQSKEFGNSRNLIYRLCKAELDLELLCKCNNNNVIPLFLNFCIANNHLKYSCIYKQCQSHLLREEICQKKLQKKLFNSLKASF